MIGRRRAMIGRLLGRGRRTRVAARIDALEAAIDGKLQALLVTATQAIAEAVRAELARERQRAGGAAPQVAPRGRPPARSLLDLESGVARTAELRRIHGTPAQTLGNARTETKA